jgi:hypothetical protein
MTEVRTEESKQIRRESQKQGRDWSPRRGKKLIPRSDQIVQALQTGLTRDHLLLDASGLTSGISTQPASTDTTSPKPQLSQTILGKLKPATSPITTFSVLDSLARRSASRASGEDLRRLVERFSTRLPALRSISDPEYYSLRTSKASSTTTKDKPSPLSFGSWGVSVTDSSGRSLILSGVASPE